MDNLLIRYIAAAITHGIYAIEKILFRCPAFIRPKVYGVSAEMAPPINAEDLLTPRRVSRVYIPIPDRPRQNQILKPLLNKILVIIFLFFPSLLSAEDSLLTLKQKLDRLQRDVDDISKLVFQSNRDSETVIKSKNNNNANCINKS